MKLRALRNFLLCRVLGNEEGDGIEITPQNEIIYKIRLCCTVNIMNSHKDPKQAFLKMLEKIHSMKAIGENSYYIYWTKKD